jgi:hypothetical protein
MSFLDNLFGNKKNSTSIKSSQPSTKETNLPEKVPDQHKTTLETIQNLASKQGEKIVIQQGEAKDLIMDVSKWGMADSKAEFDKYMKYKLDGHQLVAMMPSETTAYKVLEEICSDPLDDSVKRTLLPLDTGKALVLFFGYWTIERRLTAIKICQSHNGKVVMMTLSQNE